METLIDEVAVGTKQDPLLMRKHMLKGSPRHMAVLSLLEAVGSVEQRHDGKYRVTVGTETEVLTPPKHKDIDVQQVVDLRRMLTSAGYRAVVDELEAKGKED